MKILDQKEGNGWVIFNADCVEVARSLPSDSVDFSIFSPPFIALFVYSDSARDMGNSGSDAEFWQHYRFLIAEQFRVMKAGTIAAIHCMDIPTSKGRDGFIGLKDFPGDIIRAYQDAGFHYHSRVTIWKDPVVAVQRTKALGLLHKQLRKDSSMSRQGLPDYLIVMRKPGERVVPIAQKDFPVELWQRYASPHWVCLKEDDVDPLFARCEPDINPSETLQYKSAREEQDERHIAPLQLEVIRRGVRLWSNPGDVVLSPFAGIGSEGYVSLQEGRRFVGAELKRSYYEQACRNLAAAEPNGAGKQLSMFGGAE